MNLNFFNRGSGFQVALFYEQIEGDVVPESQRLEHAVWQVNPLPDELIRSGIRPKVTASSKHWA